MRRKTACVDWPVTVDAVADYKVPEEWEAGNFAGTFVTRSRQASTPGLIEAAEKEFGFDARDEPYRGAQDFHAHYIIRHHRPDLLLLHYDEVDKQQHRVGPRQPQVYEELETLDGLLGEVIEAYVQAGLESRLIRCVVADHGFERVDQMFKPNVVLRQAGLIDYDEQAKCITGWRAKMGIAGAAGALILADDQDAESLEQARRALSEYAGKADSPIGHFIEKPEIRRLGSNPRAAVMLDAGRGWMYSRSCAGEAIEPATIRGMHGQMPTRPELAAAFVIAGPAIPSGRWVDQISILDVAPTLARLAHVSLGKTTGHAIFETPSDH